MNITVYGTGVDDLGVPLTGVVETVNPYRNIIDRHWSMYTASTGPLTLGVVNTLPGGWLANTGSDHTVSLWDESHPEEVTAHTAGAVQYRVGGSVFVPYSSNTGSIVIRWAASTATPITSYVTLNGSAIGSSAAGAISALGDSITLDASLFVPGYNTLNFYFDHDGGSLGIRISMSSTMTSEDPGTGDQVLTGSAGIEPPAMTGIGDVTRVTPGSDQAVTGTAGIVSALAFGGGGVIGRYLSGATGIASAAAFGTGGLVGVNLVAVFGDAGLASAESFGVGGSVAFVDLPHATGQVGIPSTLAFGNGGRVYDSSGGHQVIAGIEGIPSGEAFTQGPCGIRIEPFSIPTAMFVAF